MTVKLVHHTHPLLKQTLEEFDFKHPPMNPVDLANELIECLRETKGIGISANQCGYPYRVFVLWSDPVKVCYNPRVVTASAEQVVLDEGCLSFPNLFIKIKRPQRIKVRYQDVLGDTHTETFTGMTARAFLHELDHMNGRVFTERAHPLHLERAQREQKKLNRQVSKLHKLKFEGETSGQ